MSKLPKTVEYEGVWWVPAYPDEKLIGTMTFAPEGGLRLELMLPEGFARAGNKPLPIIHGHDQHATPVTLFYCVRSNLIQSAGISKFVYHVGYCFRGVHFTKWSEAVFDEIDVSFTNLAEWVAISGFKTTESGGKWLVEYERPPEINFRTGSAFTLCLAACAKQRSVPGKSEKISQDWLIRLKYNRPTQFRIVTGHISSIRRFLIFAMGSPVAVTGLTLSNRIRDRNFGNGNFRREITCITPNLRLTNTERLDTHDLLFSFPSVRLSFESILKKWMKYHETFTDALSLYFSTVENRHLYENHLFLFLAQSLEVYHRTHRKRYKQEIEPKADFQKRVDRCVSKLDKDDEKWLRGRLTFANQATLSKRLQDIFEDKRGILGNYIDDEKKLARDIRDARNYFTHYTAVRGSNIEDGDHLAVLCHKMKVVLQVCFLSDLGIPETIIKKLLRKPNWNSVEYTEMDPPDDTAEPTTAMLLLNPAKKKRKRRK